MTARRSNGVGLRGTRRIFAALLAVCLLLAGLCGLTSCGKTSLSPEEEGAFKAEAQALIEAAALPTAICFGDGIPYDEAGEHTGSYYPADAAYLAEKGIDSLADIKAMVDAVYSAEYAALMKERMFEALHGDAGVIRYTDYYVTGKGTVMVNSNREGYYTGDVTFDFSTMTVVEVDGDNIEISIAATVGDGKGNTYTDTISLRFVGEAGSRRLDNAAFLAFVEE